MRILAWMVAVAVLAGCGGSGSAPSQTTAPTTAASGTWAASVLDAQQRPALGFMFLMAPGMGSMMTVSGFQMTQVSACFTNQATLSVQMSGSGMMGSGSTMVMDLWSGPGPTGNHLHMEMTMASGALGGSGTYTLTGVTPGCLSASGTFTMTRK